MFKYTISMLVSVFITVFGLEAADQRVDQFVTIEFADGTSVDVVPMTIQDAEEPKDVYTKVSNCLSMANMLKTEYKNLEPNDPQLKSKQKTLTQALRGYLNTSVTLLQVEA